MLLRRLVVIAAALVAARTASAQGRTFGLEDLARLVAVRGPSLSPDGRHLVYTTGRADFEENRTISQVWLVDVGTRATREILADQPGARNLIWVDNGRLAFVARGDSGNVAQVFSWDLAGGRARQLTRSATGIRAYAVSPDGGTVAYSADDQAPVRTGSERFNDAFEVKNDDFLTMSPPQPVHLWLQGTAGSPPRRLTSGGWSLATSLSTSGIQWMPDGSALVVQVFESPHSGDTDKSRVARIGLGDGAPAFLTSAGVRASGPEISADGKWIAFGSPRDGVPANLRDLHVVAASGGTVRNVSRTLDRPVSPTWLADGTMLWTGNDGTRVSLWRATADGKATKVSLGSLVTASSVSAASDGSFAFLGAERERPDEVYLWPAGADAPVRLTDHNAFLAGQSAPRTEGLEWRTPDGFQTDGVVTYPPGFDPARKHPLVLYIHGGPTAASNEGFSSRVHMLAARGWIVFQPNYRGSDNRGSAFQRAIAANPGPGIDMDVMSGIRALVRKGGVDTTRIGVSGWSFGGYVTAWLIGHHRNWKAAIVGAGAMDLFDMYALTDLNVQIRHAITQSPYVGNREAFFVKHSPLTYASQVRTPTLILHDVRDQRVTITQSYKLYHALKDNDVPVQFIAYPVAGHSPTDPVRSRDVHRRWLDWFDKHFGAVVP